jgi:2-amino-4-hydroxy-6-hydroxymethyldihydropteridine diphosphokinase
MNQAYLLIGGNQGDRMHYLEQAARLIQAECGQLVSRSSVYETAPWGITDQPTFYNQALELETTHGAMRLLELLLIIERKMGRERHEKYGPRTIDIDILFFNQDIIESPALTIPHPQLHHRRFALQPLDEIAPQWIHPVLQKSVHTLLLQCNDPLDVKKI